MSTSTPSHLGPYRLVGLVRAGGEGRVYEAVDQRLDRRVALKIRPLPEGDENREVLVREARLLATLNHANIVQLFDVMETDDAVVLVMEYLDGGDLGDLLEAGPLELSRVLRIAIDLCSALAEAHACGIVHGDLKPANVLFDAAGRIKLTDFGVAFHARQPAGTAGTPYALSPEQLASEPCDARSDLFALGCLVYRLLTARHPFAGMHDGDDDAWCDPPSFQSLGLQLPAALETLVAELLNVDAAGRPGSAVQVRRTLLAVAREYTAAAKSPAPAEALPTPHGESASRPAAEEAMADASPAIGRSARGLRRIGRPLLFVILGLTIGAGLSVQGRREAGMPVQVYLQPTSVETRDAGNYPASERLDAALQAAVRHSSAFQGVEPPGASLQLRLRCNAAVCTSQLRLGEGPEAQADTRSLLPDASEEEWRLRIEQGLAWLATGRN